jgi:1-acyl-sn-glycerol-3-phosphate acyltransferase
MSRAIQTLKWPVDALVTLLLWLVFAVLEPLLFAVPYAVAYVHRSGREPAFQRLNHLYYRAFFFALRVLVPGLRIRIADELRRIEASIVICNHVSYLDSILLVSLFPRHKTVIKGSLRRLPIMAWAMRNAGYLASDQPPGASLASLREVRQFIESGGNLFLFPEGTRSIDGRSGMFKRGPFGLARHCQAPIQVLQIQGTDILFRPRSTLFNTCVRNTIQLERIATVSADEVARVRSDSQLAEQVRQLYSEQRAA